VDEHRLTTTRRARYFTAGGGNGAPREAWIAIHGYGQLAATFLRPFEKVAAADRVIAAPEALNRFYVREGTTGSRADARIGATWMTSENRDDEIADYVDWLDAVAGRVAPAGTRLTVLGFSQGAATAVRWLSSGATRADRLVIWAGQVPPDADLPALRRGLATGSAVIVEGATDEYAPWVREARNAERLAGAGFSVQSCVFDGGHRLDDEVLARLAAG
jgi:predicted esterase